MKDQRSGDDTKGLGKGPPVRVIAHSDLPKILEVSRITSGNKKSLILLPARKRLVQTVVHEGEDELKIPSITKQAGVFKRKRKAVRDMNERY